jgi:hypothetical protein
VRCGLGTVAWGLGTEDWGRGTGDLECGLGGVWDVVECRTWWSVGRGGPRSVKCGESELELELESPSYRRARLTRSSSLFPTLTRP